jgi:hypothetical protein
MVNLSFLHRRAASILHPIPVSLIRIAFVVNEAEITRSIYIVDRAFQTRIDDTYSDGVSWCGRLVRQRILPFKMEFSLVLRPIRMRSIYIEQLFFDRQHPE